MMPSMLLLLLNIEAIFERKLFQLILFLSIFLSTSTLLKLDSDAAATLTFRNLLEPVTKSFHFSTDFTEAGTETERTGAALHENKNEKETRRGKKFRKQRSEKKNCFAISEQAAKNPRHKKSFFDFNESAKKSFKRFQRRNKTDIFERL